MIDLNAAQSRSQHEADPERKCTVNCYDDSFYPNLTHLSVLHATSVSPKETLPLESNAYHYSKPRLVIRNTVAKQQLQEFVNTIEAQAIRNQESVRISPTFLRLYDQAQETITTNPSPDPYDRLSDVQYQHDATLAFIYSLLRTWRDTTDYHPDYEAETWRYMETLEQFLITDGEKCSMPHKDI